MSSLVSICIPTFNGEQFIADAIESALSQTYQNIEIIVSDDCSFDDTLKIIESYKSKTSIPILIFKHTPKGIGANWNNCIKHSNGEHIKFLFQDDVLKPSCIEEMVKVINSDDKISLVACKREFIISNYSNAQINLWIENFKDLQSDLILSKPNLYLLDKTFLKSEMFLRSPLNKVGEPTATLFRTSIVNKVGFFNEKLKQDLDFEFYYRILKHHQIAIINKPLVNFRIHPNQATNVNRTTSVNDKSLFYSILLKDFFWYLNFKYQKKLFLNKTILGKVLNKSYHKLINIFDKSKII